MSSDEYLKAVRRTARARAKADKAFREAVLAASRAGRPLRAIADEAGMSHTGVLKIVRGGDDRG